MTISRSGPRPGCEALGALPPALLAVLSAASLPAQTAWKDLTGQPMPAIHGSSWLNTDGNEVTTESLLGKVWLFKFFATT